MCDSSSDETCADFVFQTLFWATYKYDGRRSVLESILNTHPMALKYLMPALIHFYIGKAVNFIQSTTVD